MSSQNREQSLAVTKSQPRARAAGPLDAHSGTTVQKVSELSLDYARLVSTFPGAADLRLVGAALLDVVADYYASR